MRRLGRHQRPGGYYFIHSLRSEPILPDRANRLHRLRNHGIDLLPAQQYVLREQCLRFKHMQCLRSRRPAVLRLNMHYRCLLFRHLRWNLLKRPDTFGWLRMQRHPIYKRLLLQRLVQHHPMLPGFGLGPELQVRQRLGQRDNAMVLQRQPDSEQLRGLPISRCLELQVRQHIRIRRLGRMLRESRQRAIRQRLPHTGSQLPEHRHQWRHIPRPLREQIWDGMRCFEWLVLRF